MPISIKQLKILFEACGIHLKKGLGQNLLMQEKYLNAIARACEIKPEDTVLEIGTGTGQLTEFLAPKAKKLITIDIDEKIQGIAKIHLFSLYPQIEWVLGDILKIDVKSLVEHEQSHPVKITGNLPYYITTPIIMRFLEERIPFERFVIMIQREVADRIMSTPRNKDYGVLTLMVSYYAEVSRVVEVPRDAFYPSPDVDSTVICLKPHTKTPVQVNEEKLFFSLIRSSFTQRRKKLLNSMQSIAGTRGHTKESLKALLESLEISPDARSEELTLADFARVANCLSEKS